jgi:hypothetical protein
MLRTCRSASAFSLGLEFQVLDASTEREVEGGTIMAELTNPANPNTAAISRETQAAAHARPAHAGDKTYLHRDRVALRKVTEQFAPGVEEWIGVDHEPARSKLPHTRKGAPGSWFAHRDPFLARPTA